MFERFKKQVPQRADVPKLKLTSTRLCVQCETLFQDGDKCPVCGSTGMYLTYWVPTSEGATARVQKEAV